MSVQSKTKKFNKETQKKEALLEKKESIENKLKMHNMCLRKKMFWTQFDADRRAKKIGLRAYHCPNCFQFHLTSKKMITNF